jgi:1,2-diacylglycerol 3-beta-galactosyltransferase
MKTKIALVYVDSGGGHRAAAEALAAAIREQHRPWELELISIQDLLDPIDFIRRFTGIRFQDVYNIMLRRGWTAGMQFLIPLAHLLIRCFHRQEVEVLERYWRGLRPDLVVSLIPHYNRALRESLGRARPGAPFVTVLTDIADYPPHFWIERLDQYVVCGSARAVEQALEIGMPADRILRASGMILHPRFYTPLPTDRRAARERLGLDPDRPTGLVLFGGEGSGEMRKIVRALNRPEERVQLILLCGRNEALARELRALPRHIPMFVEGFTREVPAYMELADFFIGKPGPGSISEALAKHLPAIVQRNAWTMAHERYNAQWVEERGAGIAIRSFRRQIRGAVEKLLAPENYERYRRCAAALENRAVYEIPEMLEAILQAQRGTAASGTRLLCAISPR